VRVPACACADARSTGSPGSGRRGRRDRASTDTETTSDGPGVSILRVWEYTSDRCGSAAGSGCPTCISRRALKAPSGGSGRDCIPAGPKPMAPGRGSQWPTILGMCGSSSAVPRLPGWADCTAGERGFQPNAIDPSRCLGPPASARPRSCRCPVPPDRNCSKCGLRPRRHLSGRP
jgi:hypothetical protein